MATPPVPAPKPDLNSASGATSILNSGWNFITGVLDRGFTYYAEKEQTDRLIKLREAEAKAEATKLQNYTALENVARVANDVSAARYFPYLAFGLVGLGAFVVYKTA